MIETLDEHYIVDLNASYIQVRARRHLSIGTIESTKHWALLDCLTARKLLHSLCSLSSFALFSERSVMEIKGKGDRARIVDTSGSTITSVRQVWIGSFEYRVKEWRKKSVE